VVRNCNPSGSTQAPTQRSCSLKDDLLVAIRDLAKKGAFDYLIIEASGVAEPLPVGMR